MTKIGRMMLFQGFKVDLNPYYKATTIMTMCGQENRKVSPEIDPHAYSQLPLTKLHY
jgi:hypothetical protein